MPPSESGLLPIHDIEISDRYGRRVAVHISRANFEGAHRVIDIAMAELNRTENPDLVSRRSLTSIMEEYSNQITTMDPRGNACLRVANLLENIDGISNHDPIIYVHQLLAASLSHVLAIPNAGPTVAEYLAELMKLAGFVWPVRGPEDYPMQAVFDDDVALRLQESGFKMIGETKTPEIARILMSDNWLPSEIRDMLKTISDWSCLS